jgi:mechanosensitive ion channel-like protein
MAHDIGTYFAAALGRVTAFLPNLLSALVILVIGYALSRVAGSLTRRLSARVGLDRLTAEHLRGAHDGRRVASSTAAGATVFWLGMLVTFSLMANSLNLYTLQAGLNRVLAFVPRLLVALVIVGAAFVLARFVSGFLTATAAKATRAGIIALSIFMALDQIGIARSIVLTLFTAVLGAAAVAAAVAFGIGNVGLAGEYGRRWARRGELELEEQRHRSAIGTPPPEAHAH